MRGKYGLGAVALFAFTLAGLAACDGNPAAIAARDHDSAPAYTGGYRTERASYSAPSDAAPRTSRDGAQARAPAPLVEGKPMWADNRTHTAQENAQYQFDKHGVELAAKSLDDFLAKTHKFVDHPPEGVQTLTRDNGDRLMFDPKSGLFAVARQDGAPRTIFKPDNGAAYWQSQVASGGDTRSRSSGSRSASRSGGGDGRG